MSVNSSDHHLVNSGICPTCQVNEQLKFCFYAIKTILILPLCTSVLYLGFQRWRRQRSVKSVSHSDVLTFHLAAMELFWGPGMICYLCGTYLDNFLTRLIGSCVFSLVFYGEMFFHMLTCVDRYLAVVHPIVYVRLRSTQGVKIRNACITSAWLIGLVCFYIDSSGNSVIISMLCFLTFPIIIATYCSLSVLCALIRPWPGEGGGEKERVDQLKRRAFHTITAILGVLCLWFVGLLVGIAVSQSPLISKDVRCLALSSVTCFSFPTSLVYNCNLIPIQSSLDQLSKRSEWTFHYDDAIFSQIYKKNLCCFLGTSFCIHPFIPSPASLQPLTPHT
uniref:G-protein coupled receptors family 1 profile domain-containing protein n=1 Tax=Oryzias latipes TaxID=8090 RepID=A0A3B3IFJ6_ORYLA